MPLPCRNEKVSNWFETTNRTTGTTLWCLKAPHFDCAVLNQTELNSKPVRVNAKTLTANMQKLYLEMMKITSWASALFRWPFVRVVSCALDMGATCSGGVILEGRFKRKLRLNSPGFFADRNSLDIRSTAIREIFRTIAFATRFLCPSLQAQVLCSVVLFRKVSFSMAGFEPRISGFHR